MSGKMDAIDDWANSVFAQVNESPSGDVLPEIFPTSFVEDLNLYPESRRNESQNSVGSNPNLVSLESEFDSWLNDEDWLRNDPDPKSIFEPVNFSSDSAALFVDSEASLLVCHKCHDHVDCSCSGCYSGSDNSSPPSSKLKRPRESLHGDELSPSVDGTLSVDVTLNTQYSQNRSHHAFKPINFVAPKKQDSPAIVVVSAPNRPADMSGRLAALLGSLPQEQSQSQNQVSAYKVIPDAIKVHTVRPPSSKPSSSRSHTGFVMEDSFNPFGVSGNGTLLQGNGYLFGSRKPAKQMRPLSVTRALSLTSPDVKPSIGKSVSLRPDAFPSDLLVKDNLLALAEAVAISDQPKSMFLFNQVQSLASPTGSPMQRLAYQFSAALAIRASGAGARFSSAPTRCTPQQAREAMSLCGERLPYISFSMGACNAAVLQSVLGESQVHLVDVGMWQTSYWPQLMRQLAAQPSGPPRLRVTCVDVPWTGNDFKKAVVRPAAAMGSELRAMAAQFGLPFEFSIVRCSRVEALSPSMVHKESGEALVVLCLMRVKNTWDQTVVRSSPRDRLLQVIREMGPKAFVNLEMDADLNTPFFLERFREAVDYYSAFFEVAGQTFQQTSLRSRQLFESEYMGKDIVNIVACEGMDRVTRIESSLKWAQRCRRMGFSSVRFGPSVAPSLERLLERFAVGFEVKEVPGCGFQLTWRARPMVYVSFMEPMF